MKSKAYDLHFDEIRKVFSNHLNEWPNALLSELAELISEKVNKAHEGMVVMSDEDFKEVEKKIRNEAIKECEGCVPGKLPEVTLQDPYALERNIAHNSCRNQTLQAIRQMYEGRLLS